MLVSHVQRITFKKAIDQLNVERHNCSAKLFGSKLEATTQLLEETIKLAQ